MTEFSNDLFDKILDRIRNGEGLVGICKDKDMPHRSNVMRWIGKDEILRDKYASAREAQADFYAEEIITIVDEAEDAQIARLRMDARKWTASKLAPKKYGDKITTELTGKDGASLVPIVNITTSKPNG